MKRLLIQEITAPLFRRAGTAISTYLVATGVASGTVETAVLGFTAFCGVALDLAFSYKSRK